MAAPNPMVLFAQKVADLSDQLGTLSTVNVNSREIKDSTKQLVQVYFRNVHPYLTEIGIDSKILDGLSASLQTFNHLATGNNAKSSYKACLKKIRQSCANLEIAVAIFEGQKKRSGNLPPVFFSAQDSSIISILDSMVPTAALSYQQAVFDLNQNGRSSYRGVAAELREVLRELLDHMAPDADVSKVPGFKLEQNTTKPTQRQKAKFILDSRKMSKTAQGAPIKTIEAVDELLSSLARSVYERGSISTHIGTTKAEVTQLKRYLDVVLCEFLEIT
jgi:hypothetical protein